METRIFPWHQREARLISFHDTNHQERAAGGDLFCLGHLSCAHASSSPDALEVVCGLAAAIWAIPYGALTMLMAVGMSVSTVELVSLVNAPVVASILNS